MMALPRSVSRVAIIVALLISTLGLAACFPLVASGVAFGALALIDRRTIGAQTEDQSIELKARTRLREQLTDSSGVSATSYNRRVLITGQVASDSDKQAAGAIVAGLDNVRGVFNELERAELASLQVTANDIGITTRVKTALLRDDIVPGNSIKVKTEGGVVYLMGLTTTEEAERAARIASNIAGVVRVITVFEIITTAEAQEMSRAAQREQQPAQPPAQPPAGNVTTPTPAGNGTSPVAPPTPVLPSDPTAPAPQNDTVTPSPRFESVTPGAQPDRTAPQPQMPPASEPPPAGSPR